MVTGSGLADPRGATQPIVYSGGATRPMEGAHRETEWPDDAPLRSEQRGPRPPRPPERASPDIPAARPVAPPKPPQARSDGARH